jgi:surfeit locus 1 family protein
VARPALAGDPGMNPGLLLTRRWLPTTILAILGIAVMVRLGIWQLDRLEQRRQSNALLAAQRVASPLQLDTEEPPDDGSAWAGRIARVAGRFDYERQFLLALQPWEGRPGAHLITPLLVDGSERAILVDRGWIPDQDVTAGALRRFDEPEAGQVAGVLRPSHPYSRPEQRPVGPQGQWHRMDIEGIQAQMPYPLWPVYLEQLPPAGEERLPYKASQEPDLSEGPHLGYAIQWFLFSAVLALGYLRFISLRNEE